MTKKQARSVALHDICQILGSVTSGIDGVAPAYQSNRFISDKDKKLITREWQAIAWGLYKRLEKAER